MFFVMVLNLVEANSKVCSYKIGFGVARFSVRVSGLGMSSYIVLTGTYASFISGILFR